MKIIVVGPGALGCLFAAFLGRSNEVWVLDHDPNRAKELQAQGLVLDHDGKTVTVNVNVTTDISALPSAELVLLCVKSSSVKKAVLSIMPLVLRDQPLLIALQNGIGHLNILPELVLCPWALGVTSQGATLAGPGKVMHRGEGLTQIGYSNNSNSDIDKDRLAKVARIISESGIETKTATNIEIHVWNKLLVNVGINALTAINNCPNGMLLESRDIMQTMKEAVTEGELVARASSVNIGTDPVGRTMEVCRATAENISSMLQDVRKKRKTEIESINGALVRIAHQIGIPVPVNEELARKVREIEKSFH